MESIIAEGKSRIPRWIFLEEPRTLEVMTPWKQRRRGQTMLEYILVLAMTLGIILTLGFFMYVFKEHGGRILDLISSVYP
jgi:hypothetical protein